MDFDTDSLRPQEALAPGGASSDMDRAQRCETPLDKLLHGRAEGGAVALRACTDELFAAARLRFGADVERVRFLDPCRAEHPHSAFLRKNVTRGGQSAIQETLYAPDGRLSEERPAEGPAYEYFVKKPDDFEVLRGHLRDVELHAAKPGAETCAALANAGLTPVRELETRWAGPQMTAWALSTQNEAAASCLRKLERQFRRRAEEAERLGCRAGVLRDLAVEPLPEAWLPQAAKHLEWMRHAGVFPWVEAKQWDEAALSGIFDAHAGARLDLSCFTQAEEQPLPPKGMRLLLDAQASLELNEDFERRFAAMLEPCASAIVLVDCFALDQEKAFKMIEKFGELIAARWSA